MTYRIITHGGCSDGFASAFFFKKYWKYLVPELTQEDIDNAEVIGVQPRDVQSNEYEFTKKDILLDLPKPDTEIFFWCDHHSSNKQEGLLPKNHFWKVAPGNCGYLMEIAVKNGLKLTEELKSFKKNTDKMDSADYTADEIKLCYYKQDDYDNSSDLLKMHIIAAMFHTRDNALNDEIFRTLLSQKLSETPLSSKPLWQLNPLMFHRARMEGFKLWREVVDEYLHLDGKTVVQDDRETKVYRGVADRFYSYIKFPKSSYNLALREMNDGVNTRVSIGSNIFHKDRCKVDIGKLCKDVGRKFGEGSGGGHFYVGGATINKKNTDEAKKFILESLN